ncbi:hypothetical protein A4A49_41328 [Nicotiana attenuata]|uniref:DUF4283 domain-containing protein n=1 Tax=Nicotiana attenuata TaxID=49451 RepID=A0A1J6KE99_NICAT|nr:hypothetical protein A4A49_41328 [Nicotiana attenuata]
MANQPSDPIDTKLDYATKVISLSIAPTPSNCHGRESVISIHTMHNCMPAVLFKATDYYGVMAEECKLTIVGRFLKPRPQIDKIRSKFKELISIKGSVKIGVYDMYNVFLDFTNDKDFNSVWFRRVIEIEGQQMWLQKWSPDFKSEEDLHIAPVWVLLLGLPFHMHTWNYVKQVVSAIGTPLEMDLAIKGRTRPSMAKGVPKYCKFCRKLGHNLVNCRALERKKAAENRELEAQKTADNQNEDNRGIVDQNLKAGTAFNREAAKQIDHAENQNEANRGIVDQNLEAGTAFNREAAKQIDQNRESESAESGTAVNNEQTENRITPKQKSEIEFDKPLQQPSSNIRERFRKKTKKEQAGKTT